jgi:uncharacterized protein (UPF0212 family)
MKSLSFHCPHCNQHIEAEPAWAGRDLDCPNCKQAFIVPKPGRHPAWLASAIALIGLILCIISANMGSDKQWSSIAWITGLVLIV